MQTFNLASEFVDPEAERGLLASLAQDTDLYWQLLDLLPEGTFAVEVGAWTKLDEAIAEEQNPVVPGQWIPAPNPEASARRLADLHQRRLLAAAQERLGQALYNPEYPAQALAALLEEEAVRIQTTVHELKVGQAISLPSLFNELLTSLQERRKAMQDGLGVVGLPSGLSTLDRLLGGFQSGVHLLAAQPGMGKTTLTLQMATHIASHGQPVLFVSFEEPLDRLTLKAVCQVAGLEAKRYAEGYADPQEVEVAMLKNATNLSSLYLVEGTGRLSVAHIKAKALSAMSKHKTDRCLIIVDYLQRWASSRRDFTDYRHVVSGLVSELRELALRLKNPVLAISSQNRPGQGGASLTSLKESGDLEYSADTAMFLIQADDREVTPPLRAVDLVVAKNRFGDVGKVPLIFRPEVGSMREVSGYDDIF